MPATGFFYDVLTHRLSPEEVGTPDRYIVPDNQTAAIEWNKVPNKSSDNDLKRGDPRSLEDRRRMGSTKV